MRPVGLFKSVRARLMSLSGTPRMGRGPLWDREIPIHRTGQTCERVRQYSALCSPTRVGGRAMISLGRLLGNIAPKSENTCVRAFGHVNLQLRKHTERASVCVCMEPHRSM